MEIPRLIRRLYRKYKTNCPFMLAAHLNIEIWFLKLDDDCRGFALRTLKRKYIAINNDLSEEEQRIVCAHELGHLLLHRGIGYYFLEQKTLYLPNKYERQANHFAIQLLSMNHTLETDETKEHFLLRCGIPYEFHEFY